MLASIFPYQVTSGTLGKCLLPSWFGGPLATVKQHYHEQRESPSGFEFPQNDVKILLIRSQWTTFHLLEGLVLVKRSVNSSFRATRLRGNMWKTDTDHAGRLCFADPQTSAIYRSFQWIDQAHPRTRFEFTRSFCWISNIFTKDEWEFALRPCHFLMDQIWWSDSRVHRWFGRKDHRHAGSSACPLEWILQSMV